MSLSKHQCFFAPCNSKTAFQKCTNDVIKKIISISLAKGDSYHELLEHLVDESGALVSGKEVPWCHKGCYCSYTSVSRNVPKAKKGVKRAASCPPPCDRVLKSQVPEFTREDFKTKCFLCSELCFPMDPKHLDRWQPWKQCETEPILVKISPASNRC